MPSASSKRLKSGGRAGQIERIGAGGAREPLSLLAECGITREPENHFRNTTDDVYNRWEAAGPTQLLWAAPGLVPLERPPPSFSKD